MNYISLFATAAGPLARRCWLEVRYTPRDGGDSTDISEDLRNYLLSMTYTDNMSGEVDTCDLTLEDRARLWSGDWLPEQGAFLDITLFTYNWASLATGEEKFHVGKFQIDSIEIQGYPSTVALRCVSANYDSKLRGAANNRSWDNTTTYKVANDIAGYNGLGLYWDASDDVYLGHVEQSDKSDLEFLKGLCDDNGYSLKIDIDKIIVFDDEKLETKEPGLIIHAPGLGGNLTSYSFNAKLRDVYKACHVKYQKDKEKQLIESTFSDPGIPAGPTLEVSQQVDDQTMCDRLARKKLREKNKEAVTGSMSAKGSVWFVGGMIAKLEGFNKFDGKYVITRAQHTIGQSWTTSIDLRRCLNGY